MTDSVYPNLIVCGDSTAVGTVAVGTVKDSRVDISEGSPCLAKSLITSFPNLQRIGRHGCTAEEIYQKVQRFVFPEGPCIVVVTFGTNDVARCADLETTIHHTQAILNHFTSRGHPVFGLPPYPFHRLPLVEAVLNNWQGDYGNIQSMQAYFNDLPEMYKAFKDKSLEEIQDHADALIAGMEKVFRNAEQPFLLELIEDAYGMSFRNRMRMFQNDDDIRQCDGIHLTERSYNIAAGKILEYIQHQSLILLPRSATDRSPSS